MEPLVIQAGDVAAPEVGVALWCLDDARARTLRVLDDVPDEWLDRPPVVGQNSIGTLLYHVAAIELDWLYADVLRVSFPDEARSWFPVDVRDVHGRLTPLAGDSRERHLERLAWVRDLVRRHYVRMEPERFRRGDPGDERPVSPQWVLHHLCQHEAEHRGHVQALVEAFAATARS